MSKPTAVSSLVSSLGIGEYPKNYNPKVHGPYYPFRYYGKQDLHITDVKLGEISQWLSRRDYNISAIAKAFPRAYHRYLNNWVNVKRPGFAFLGQIMMTVSIVSYVAIYDTVKWHKNCKYH